MVPTVVSRIMGANLKNQRVCMGVAVAELAEKADVSSDTIYKIERGNVQMSPELKFRFARILSCSPQTFEDGLDLDDGEVQTPLSHGMRRIDSTVRQILRKLASEWTGNIKALIIFTGMIAAFPPEERREIYMQGIIVRDRLLSSGKIRQEELPPEMEYMEDQLGELYRG